MTKARIPTVIRAGRDSGSRIRTKKRILVAPSTVAASSSSAGIARMNGRRMTMVTGSENAASGSATPNRLSFMPIFCSSRNGGKAAVFEREQQSGREQQEQSVAPAEDIPGQREGGHRAEYHGQRGCTTATTPLVWTACQNPAALRIGTELFHTHGWGR